MPAIQLVSSSKASSLPSVDAIALSDLSANLTSKIQFKNNRVSNISNSLSPFSFL